jgi:hypothetical protein
MPPGCGGWLPTSCGFGHEVDGAIESMTGARFVHDLASWGWPVMDASGRVWVVDLDPNSHRQSVKVLESAP